MIPTQKKIERKKERKKYMSFSLSTLVSDVFIKMAKELMEFRAH